MGFIVKNTTMPGLLDLLLPHSCRGCGRIGNALCDCCKKNILIQQHNFCPQCKAKNKTGKCHHCKNLPPFYVAAERSGLIDNLIHNYKYSSNRSLAKPLAEILSSCLPDIEGPVVIVPIPTNTKHLRERGFDHTKLLAKQLSKLHPHWQTKRVLLRVNNTVQVGSSKSKRKEQAEKAYQISPKFKADKNTTYIIIDDVWTTGASMLSAIKKLRFAGVSRIIAAVLAVSRLDN